MRYVITLLLATSSFFQLQACSRIFWNQSSCRVSARTTDLYTDESPEWVLSPRNIPRSGGNFKNSVEWTSKFGSIVITAFKKAISEGCNEKGLAVHLLYLHDTEYEKRDSRPGLSNLLWVQYILDNFATVTEALTSLSQIQIISCELEGKLWPLHICMEDSTGDSAIIEFIKGKIHIHHGGQFTVVTNEPAYDIQLKNLQKYRYFGGNLPLPGDVDPMSRFVRASAFLKTLIPPVDITQALGFVLGVVRTIQVPFGAIDTSGNNSVDSWPTRWISAIDFNHLTYYFNSTSSPNIVWIDFAKLDFSAQTQHAPIHLQDANLSGDLSHQFGLIQKQQTNI